MTTLEDGKYYIRPSTVPDAKIGADYGLDTYYPVVAGGKDFVWTVTQVREGTYTLILEETSRYRFSQVVEGTVQVSLSGGDIWTIQAQADETYSIEVLNGLLPRRVWTMFPIQVDPKAPVIVLPVDKDVKGTDLLPEQLWKFVRALE